MKYYFIAFSLLMSTSAIAIDDDQEASHFPTGKQEVYNSSDEESDEHYSSAEYHSSGEESDGEPVYLYPISFQKLNSIPPVEFTGLTPEEQNKALIEAIQKANPGLHLPVPKAEYQCIISFSHLYRRKTNN